MGMVKPGQYPELAVKTGETGLGFRVKVEVEELDGDRPVIDEIRGFVDNSHTPSTQKSLNLVTAVNRLINHRLFLVQDSLNIRKVRNKICDPGLRPGLVVGQQMAQSLTLISRLFGRCLINSQLDDDFFPTNAPS
jgi:hypothetical protein